MQGVCHLVEDVGGNQLPMLVDLVDLDRPRSERESFDAGVAVSVFRWTLVLFPYHVRFALRLLGRGGEVAKRGGGLKLDARARWRGETDGWKCVGDHLQL